MTPRSISGLCTATFAAAVSTLYQSRNLVYSSFCSPKDILRVISEITLNA